MFSGIVEELGTIREATTTGLTIGANLVLEGTKLGDSVNVNGACLTLTRRGDDWFTVDTVPETLRRTNLGTLRPGGRVNLERSLLANGRVSGHFVQGHVEATGVVADVRPDGPANLVTIQSPPDLLRQIVPKGFVAVDGISLTVIDRTTSGFRLTLIPFTMEMTTAGTWTVGSSVNLESDILVRAVFSRLDDGVGVGSITTTTDGGSR